MKKATLYILFSITFLSFLSCSTSTLNKKEKVQEEPVVIKNDSLEYEIIIIDNGFNTYLNSIARPSGYYSQNYLEVRNRLYVPLWNLRVNNPTQFNPNIYENIIDYDPNVDYGYDVNYKLFNYFEFAQRKYRMRLR